MHPRSDCQNGNERRANAIIYRGRDTEAERRTEIETEMNWSFFSGSSKGMGGGAGMLRALRTGIESAQQPSISTARPANPLTLLSLSSALKPPPSSDTSSITNAAASTVLGCSSSHPCFIDVEDDWEAIEGDEEGLGFRFVFGPVPSREEAENAVSAVHQFILQSAYPENCGDSYASAVEKNISDEIMDSNNLVCHISSSESGSDWIEPVLHFSIPKALESHRYRNVLDAFRLLKRNTSVQRMVISLSSDKAVWNAVMNNDVVRELRDSFYADHSCENDQPKSSKENDPKVSMKFLRWLFCDTRAKLTEIVSKIMKLTNDLFRPPANGKHMDAFETTLKSSLMLSIVVLLVIVMNRIKGC